MEMLIKDQVVKVRWNNRLAKHYISKGYKKLKPQEIFNVHINDLPKNSNIKVKVECDNCKEIIYRTFAQSKVAEFHFCSSKCEQKFLKYDKAFLIEEFYRFYKEFGRYPFQSDMQANKGFPSYYNYIKAWGSWCGFLNEISLPESIYDNWSQEDIKIIKTMYENYPKEKILENLSKDVEWNTVRAKAKKLGLKRKYKDPSKKAFTRDFLISEFWRYYKTYGKYPLCKDLIKTDGFPSDVGYKRIWGSWNNFLRDIGIIRKDNKDGWYICDEEVLIKYYETYPQQFILNKLMIKRKWETIKAKASKLGLKRNLSLVKQQYDNEFLLNELIRYKNKFGKSPSCSDIDKAVDFPSSKLYIKRYGSWNTALKLAGLEINQIKKYTKDEIKEEVLDFYNLNNRSPFYHELSYSSTVIRHYWNSWNEMLKDMDLPVNKSVLFKTCDEGLDFLKRLSKELNKIPTSGDLVANGVNKSWYEYHFGSLKKALFKAGLIEEWEITIDYDELINNNIKLLIELGNTLQRVPTVQEYVDFLDTQRNNTYLSRETFSKKLKMSYLEICDKYLPIEILTSENNNFFLNKNGERCRSYPEKIISNLFIENNIDYNYEPRYNEVMKIDNDYIFDWRINQDIYVEYFGYVRNGEQYNDFTKEYYLKHKEKIRLCKENNIKLIDLYPQDIDNDFYQLINKFNKFGIHLEK